MRNRLYGFLSCFEVLALRAQGRDLDRTMAKLFKNYPPRPNR